MAEGRKLQCVVVTPERPVLDVAAGLVVLPMVDGELGIQPQHSPLVGRLGKGEMRISGEGATKSLRVEGGFVQVRNDVVTVLTSRVVE